MTFNFKNSDSFIDLAGLSELKIGPSHEHIPRQFLNFIPVVERTNPKTL
jgi:hypothetical protein